MGHFSEMAIEQMNDEGEALASQHAQAQAESDLNEQREFEESCDKLYRELKGKYGSWMGAVVQGLRQRFDNDNDNSQPTYYMVNNITDGIPASPEIMTMHQAEEFVAEFPKRFEIQGYYKTATGERIDPKDVVLVIMECDSSEIVDLPF